MRRCAREQAAANYDDMGAEILRGQSFRNWAGGNRAGCRQCQSTQSTDSQVKTGSVMPQSVRTRDAPTGGKTTTTAATPQLSMTATFQCESRWGPSTPCSIDSGRARFWVHLFGVDLDAPRADWLA